MGVTAGQYVMMCVGGSVTVYAGFVDGVINRFDVGVESDAARFNSYSQSTSNYCDHELYQGSL